MTRKYSTRTVAQAQVPSSTHEEHPGSGLPRWIVPGWGTDNPRLTFTLDPQALDALSRLSNADLGALTRFGLLRAAGAGPWSDDIARAERGLPVVLKDAAEANAGL